MFFLFCLILKALPVLSENKVRNNPYLIKTQILIVCGFLGNIVESIRRCVPEILPNVRRQNIYCLRRGKNEGSLAPLYVKSESLSDFSLQVILCVQCRTVPVMYEV